MMFKLLPFSLYSIKHCDLILQKCDFISWLINSDILIVIFVYSYSLYVYKNLLSTNKYNNKNL